MLPRLSDLPSSSSNAISSCYLSHRLLQNLLLCLTTAKETGQLLKPIGPALFSMTPFGVTCQSLFRKVSCTKEERSLVFSALVQQSISPKAPGEVQLFLVTGAQHLHSGSLTSWGTDCCLWGNRREARLSG